MSAAGIALDELPPLAAITDEDWGDDRWRKPRSRRRPRYRPPSAVMGRRP